MHNFSHCLGSRKTEVSQVSSAVFSCWGLTFPVSPSPSAFLVCAGGRKKRKEHHNFFFHFAEGEKKPTSLPSLLPRLPIFLHLFLLSLSLSLHFQDFQEILLGEKTIPRRYFFPSRVRRRPLRAGRVRGTLFVPADGPRGGSGSPLAVTVYGGVLKGAVMEEKAAVLASYGILDLRERIRSAFR